MEIGKLSALAEALLAAREPTELEVSERPLALEPLAAPDEAPLAVSELLAAQEAAPSKLDALGELDPSEELGALDSPEALGEVEQTARITGHGGAPALTGSEPAGALGRGANAPETASSYRGLSEQLKQAAISPRSDEAYERGLSLNLEGLFPGLPSESLAQELIPLCSLEPTLRRAIQRLLSEEFPEG